MEWMEFIAFGCNTLNEKRQRVRKGRMRLLVLERLQLEIAYWILMIVFIVLVGPVSLFQKLSKGFRRE